MSLLDHANKVASSALPLIKIPYGPWKGSVRSVSADQVVRRFGREWATTGQNVLYSPRTGWWRRRAGSTQKFDTFGASDGLLPANWVDAGTGKGARCRDFQEFTSDAISDNVPTLCALLTTETIVSGFLDDGLFSNFYWRDQVGNFNRTFGDEYGTGTTYPAPGTAQYYRVIPLWYESGQGGLTRGTAEFARRFFFSGSRRFLKIGNWYYFPSLKGTPSRWNGFDAVGSGSLVGALANATVFGEHDDDAAGSFWSSSTHGAGDIDSTPAIHEDIDDAVADDATTFIRSNSTPGGSGLSRCRFVLDEALSTSINQWVVTIRAAKDDLGVNNNATFKMRLSRSDGLYAESAEVNIDSYFGASWADYEFTIDFSGGSTAHTQVPAYTTANTIELVVSSASGDRIMISRIEVQTASEAAGSTVQANRLIPSGPLPPVHAGTITAGASAAAAYLRPDATSDPDGWTAVGAATHHEATDDTTANDADYITSTTSGADIDLGLSNFSGSDPVAGDQVVLRIRARQATAGTVNFTALLIQGAATTRATLTSGTINNFWYDHYVVLNDTEIGDVTDWDDLTIRITANNQGALNPIYISQAYLEHTPAAALTEGGWKGHDRFYHSVAYRFEDDSVWMPCVPRAPNDINQQGYNLNTLDIGNPDTSYRYVRWSNLPVGPHGVKSKLLLRTPKIDATLSDNLQLNPFDLRVVDEIPNEITTYDDFFGDDLSLTLDPEQKIIRFDHMMPPRSRYIFAGDMRACHSYGGENPCAIILAPVGRSADYDLNDDDTESTLYNQNSSYVFVSIDTSSVMTITLVKSDGTNLTTKSFAAATYNTLQKLVDAINTTTVGVDGLQWRAQLCPNADGDADPTTALTPHTRDIASCVVDDTAKTITKSAGGLSKVAVGSFIVRAGTATTAYVTKIVSDTVLHYTGTVTAGTVTITFVFQLGDDPNVATTSMGRQRVIANSLPGFLYFNEATLNKVPLRKNASWMTVAGPGSMKSAPNCFSSKIANLFTPPSDAGISLGGGSVDEGFVLVYSQKIGAIRNVRDSGTGVDEDYRLFIINDTSGGCAYNTVTPGNRVVFYLKPEGMAACDLFKEKIISEAIWVQPPENRGDFDFEIPLCIAASAEDDDDALATAKVMRSALWVSYRASGTHPNRQVVYDFSNDGDMSGMDGILRNGEPYGWSVPLVRSVSCMTMGRRAVSSDYGIHLYGWNDENAGTDGDGRIDEIEVGTQDNGTDIDARLSLPWERADGFTLISAQEFTMEHLSPSGSTGSVVFHRSFSDDTYTLTPSTNALVVLREVKMLSQAARVGANACYLEWRQATGTTRELRAIELRVKKLPSYT